MLNGQHREAMVGHRPTGRAPTEIGADLQARECEHQPSLPELAGRPRDGFICVSSSTQCQYSSVRQELRFWTIRSGEPNALVTVRDDPFIVGAPEFGSVAKVDANAKTPAHRCE